MVEGLGFQGRRQERKQAVALRTFIENKDKIIAIGYDKVPKNDSVVVRRGGLNTNSRSAKKKIVAKKKAPQFVRRKNVNKAKSIRTSP